MSPLQSGNRIKQQMTGLVPVDPVFDVEPGEGGSVCQVFHRLINVTGQALTGLAVEPGLGFGDGFVEAGDTDGIRFSPDLSARPTGGGPASTLFPFGLFGDATNNPNVNPDGFFAPQRTGLDVDATDPTRR